MKLTNITNLLFLKNYFQNNINNNERDSYHVIIDRKDIYNLLFLEKKKKMRKKKYKDYKISYLIFKVST